MKLVSVLQDSRSFSLEFSSWVPESVVACKLTEFSRDEVLMLLTGAVLVLFKMLSVHLRHDILPASPITVDNISYSVTCKYKYICLPFK